MGFYLTDDASFAVRWARNFKNHCPRRGFGGAIVVFSEGEGKSDDDDHYTLDLKGDELSKKVISYFRGHSHDLVDDRIDRYDSIRGKLAGSGVDNFSHQYCIKTVREARRWNARLMGVLLLPVVVGHNISA